MVQCNAHRSTIVDNVVIQYYCCWLQLQQLQATFDVVYMCACVCVCVCVSRGQARANRLLTFWSSAALRMGPHLFPTPQTPRRLAQSWACQVRLPPPPLDMAMGVDFDQEKRQEGTGQKGRQKERHLEGGRLELEQASAASPEKKVPLTHWHFRGVPSLKLEV